MYTNFRNTLRVSFMLMIVLALAAVGAFGSNRAALAAPPTSPSSARSADLLPATTCSPSCDLYATTGMAAMPDGSIVDIWGFSPTSGGPAELPGPAIIVNQGDSVSVTLHNEMAAETVALVFPGQDLVPDLTGAAPGGSVTYNFTPAEPGTFSYEAGLTMNGARQVAMGMFGALIVRPTSGALFANDEPESAFDAEALIVINEIDPDFHADPNGYMMQDYHAKYWLVNGKAYPDTDPIPAIPGERLLLRYLNGGAETNYLSTLGLRQTILGTDGVPLPTSKTHQTVSEAVPAGSSLDTLVTIPASATVGTRYALYNPGMVQLQNNDSWTSNTPVDFGGMMTFIEVSGGTAIPDTGPIASNVMINPSISAANSDATLSAHLDEATTGGENIDAWEYFISQVGPEGSGNTFILGAPTPAVDVSATVLASTLQTLSPGDVTFYVRGRDADGNWGPVSSVVMDLVVEGPVIRGMLLNPGTTNGMVDVAIQATADDTATGNVNVVEAEYFIDPALPVTPNTGMPLALNGNKPVVSLTGSIPAATVNSLAEGAHTIFIHARDTLDNWGSGGEITLMVDKSGPGAIITDITPNPNNGQLAVNASSNAVRVRGILIDSAAIERAEGFINTVGADGTGFPLIPADGLYNLSVESAYADIPLPTINLLPEGQNLIYIHGKDIAGNWGPVASQPLIIDKTGPLVNPLAVFPNPTARSTFALLTTTASDVTTGGLDITAAEWFEGPDPGIGNGTPMAATGSFGQPTVGIYALIDVSGWNNGPHTISVRASDAIGNWSDIQSVTLIVSGNNPNNILADGFETGGLASWNATRGAANVTEAAALVDQFGLQAPIDVQNPAYVVDRTPSSERGYTVNFMFNPNDTVTADGSVDIFVGQNSYSSQVFAIRYENGASGPEIQAAVATSAGIVTTEWHHLTAGANKIEVRWLSGADKSFVLLVNDAVVQELNGLDTSSFLLEEVMLGSASGLKPGMSGIMYFDNFTSLRPIPEPGDLPFRTFLPLVTK